MTQPERFAYGRAEIPNGPEILGQHGDYCEACFTVTRDICIFSLYPQFGSETMLPVILWMVKLSDLVHAAESGCHFCGIIATRFFEAIDSGSFGQGFIKNNVACCSAAPRGTQADGLERALSDVRTILENSPRMEITFVAEPVDYSPSEGSFRLLRFSVKSVDHDASTFNTNSREIHLEFYACENSLASEYIKPRPINIQPGSDEHVKQARKWIDECFHEHDDCPGPSESETTVPTRLIKIQDNGRLVLHENNEAMDTGKYTALSYCWGGPQEFATVKSSYGQNVNGFNSSDLPQTLRDGITLTKRLGLQYIWIDSLCIIQDSDSDKERELAEMATYYKNAYVTICAATGDNCHTGFLQTHHECQTHPGTGIPFDLLRMPFLHPEGKVGEMLFREPCPYVLAWEPIEKRAWTFQERVLSPRILYYGGRTLWRCHHHKRSHGGIDDFSFDKRSFDYIDLQSRARAMGSGSGEENVATATAAADGGNTPDDLYTIWHQAVHTFSVRSLSQGHDKLPAIAGFASEFARVTCDTYLAGLWKSRLLRELLWSTWPALNPTQPQERRAPSWSWAAVDNSIMYQQPLPAGARPIATVLKCSVTPMDSHSVFGRNQDGVLEIEGLALRESDEIVCEILKDEYELKYPGLSAEFDLASFLDVAMVGRGNGFFQNFNEWQPPENCVFLPLFVVERSEDHRYNAHGLVLVKNEDGTYKRFSSFTKVVLQHLEMALERFKQKVVII